MDGSVSIESYFFSRITSVLCINHLQSLRSSYLLLWRVPEKNQEERARCFSPTAFLFPQEKENLMLLQNQPEYSEKTVLYIYPSRLFYSIHGIGDILPGEEKAVRLNFSNILVPKVSKREWKGTFCKVI